MWSSIPKPIFALAPMAGITDSAFRLVCREIGADVVYSEMASVSALYFKPEKTLELLRFSQKEQPYVVQLFGKDPLHFAKATQIVSDYIPIVDYHNDNLGGIKNNSSQKNAEPKSKTAKPAGIDINFGCPAKKVFGHGSGAALMSQPKLAQEIIKTVVANTDLPVSIKVRAEVKDITIADFLKNIKVNTLGIKAIMIHGRSYQQGFRGAIDCEKICWVQENFEGIVLANGGIKTVEDARDVLEKTGVAGVGIGTGIYGNPDLFHKLQSLKEKTDPVTFSFDSRLEMIRRHAQYAYQLKGEHGIIEMRKHLLWYFKGIPHIKEMRPRIVAVSSIEDIEKIIQTIKVSC